MDLKDTGTSRFVRKREFDFAIETTGTEEGRVEDVDSVCCCDDLRDVQCQGLTDGGKNVP